MTKVQRYRWKADATRPPALAVRIDTGDYDGLCWLVGWCGGRAVDGGDVYVIDDDHNQEPVTGTAAVLAIDTESDPLYGRHDDWVVRASSGLFTVCDPVQFDATFEPDS